MAGVVMNERQKHYAQHLRYDEKHWRHLLAKGKADYVRDAVEYDLIDYDGQHRLFISAVIRGYADIVMMLLERGADLHANHDIALLKAASRGHVDVMDLLIAAGADVYANEGEALSKAAEKGHLAMVKYLLAQMNKISPLRLEREYTDHAVEPRLVRVDPDAYKHRALILAADKGYNRIADSLFDDLAYTDELPDNLACYEAVKASWEKRVIKHGLKQWDVEKHSGGVDEWMGL